MNSQNNANMREAGAGRAFRGRATAVVEDKHDDEEEKESRATRTTFRGLPHPMKSKIKNPQSELVLHASNSCPARFDGKGFGLVRTVSLH